MIEGMRMDMVKPRYDTYDELYEYCYRVAGTVALMSNPVMGIAPDYKVTRGSSWHAWLVHSYCYSLLVYGTHGLSDLFNST